MPSVLLKIERKDQFHLITCLLAGQKVWLNSSLGLMSLTRPIQQQHHASCWHTQKNVLCFLLLSFAAYLSQLLRSSQSTEGELSGCFQDLCTLSVCTGGREKAQVFSQSTLPKAGKQRGQQKSFLKCFFLVVIVVVVCIPLITYKKI